LWCAPIVAAPLPLTQIGKTDNLTVKHEIRTRSRLVKKLVRSSAKRKRLAVQRNVREQGAVV
jgi:hypothetical protein